MELVEIDAPRPKEGEALIKVERVGICGTDIHIWHGHFSKTRPPVTLGHEFSGTVAEVGPGVEGWEKGARVTVESAAHYCGNCTYCEEGFTNVCEGRLAFGYGVDGAFANYVVTRASGLHRLPDSVSFQEAALTEPLAVGAHAVIDLAHLGPNDTALITGPGPIGLIVLQVAKTRGATVVITGAEPDRERLQLARELGADHCLIVGKDNPKQTIDGLTDGLGVHVAFECSGVGAAFQDCLELTRKLGRVIQVGLYGKPAQVDMDLMTFKEITVRGSFTHYHETWNTALALLGQGKVSMKPLVSGEFPLHEWKEAFQLSEKGSGLKYLLYPES